MKESIKSQHVDYAYLYSVLFSCTTFCLLYISFNFFLPTSNYVAFIALLLSLISFILYFIKGTRLLLVFSLIVSVLFFSFSLVF